jgi:hypothetical protein
MKDRPSHPYFGRVEDFHVSYEGVSYDPSDDTQDVFIEGVLSPPGFDAAAPTAGAPPGGWPLLLLLPAEGSEQVEEPRGAALDALEEARTQRLQQQPPCHALLSA